MFQATNAGEEAPENKVGRLSQLEARAALRKHKGNVWASVTECVDGRQAMFDQLESKGNFEKEDIVTALTASEGDMDLAFGELNKIKMRPFLMRIWGKVCFKVALCFEIQVCHLLYRPKEQIMRLAMRELTVPQRRLPKMVPTGRLLWTKRQLRARTSSLETYSRASSCQRKTALPRRRLRQRKSPKKALSNTSWL